jgi:hypothetical protein
MEEEEKEKEEGEEEKEEEASRTDVGIWNVRFIKISEHGF